MSAALQDLRQPAAPEAPEAASAPARRRRRWLRRLVLVVLIVWVVPNLAILGAHLAFAATRPGATAYPGVDKFGVVDGRVWRGAAPTMAGYRQLAADGVTTVVDLRAEAPPTLEADLAPLGLQVVRIPVRDGQSPSPEDLERFLEIVDESPGIVFVHCGAGVGRTGVMAAARQSAADDASGPSTVADNLAMGTPSLEQLFTAATLDDGRSTSSPLIVVAASRVVDGPRRLFHVLGF